MEPQLAKSISEQPQKKKKSRFSMFKKKSQKKEETKSAFGGEEMTVVRGVVEICFGGGAPVGEVLEGVANKGAMGAISDKKKNLLAIKG